MIVDTHSHFVPQALLDDLAKQSAFPSVKTTMENGGLCMSFADNKPTRPVMPLMSDVAKRREWLTAQHIDKQVVGGRLNMFAYELPPEEGADWSRYLNEHLLNGMAQVPKLIPIATVPMQSGKLAAKVLNEALDAGFHGAMIGTQPKGLGGALDNPDLDPFWEAASARNTDAEAALSKQFAASAVDDIKAGSGTLSSDLHGTAEYRARRSPSCSSARSTLRRKRPNSNDTVIWRHRMSQSATGAGIGQSVRRLEDKRLITGQGRFSDDMNLPGQVHAVMLRSPHAHARIKSIGIKKAMAVPGVLAVLTGKDLLADGLKPIPHIPLLAHPAEIQPVNSDGTPMFTAPHYPLAIDKVRYVGEAVAIIVARSIAAAKDGSEQVEVDYEPLPAVTDTVAAAEPDAPRLFDEAKSNVCLDAQLGDKARTEAAFARAAHVAKFETWVQRITGAPMEPRAALSEYNAETKRYTLYAGSGGAVRLKNDLATVLGVSSDSVRVIMHDVGGNFGTRGMIYPEFCLAAWAARRVGRPVKWLCERSEAFLCDYQARDLAVQAELALDAEGNFLAMRGSNIGNAGAHTTNFSPLQKGVEIMSSIYRMPAASFRARAVLSNTSPTRPYRSAGRPEVMYVMERLIDLACRDFGFDRVDIRRRNLLTPNELPYKNPFGMTYDSGHYQEVMDWALREGDWDGFPARRAEARQRGKYRGIAVANYVDTATGQPRERTEITIQRDGWTDVVIGTVSNGQGHETSFAQLINEWFAVPLDKVRIITHDTDIVKVGGGTHSGRGMRLASYVMKIASDEIIDKAKRLAGHLLEAAPGDIAFGGGKFWVKGTDRAIGLFALAAASVERNDLPDDLRGPLASTCDKVVKEAAFPYGAHVCEVEVDPLVGNVEIVRYSAVDDVGRAVNPLIIHGQTHGGIAQGVGQALLEHCAYNAGSGQLMSGSFMDYAMPRADNFPFFNTLISEVPTPEHPLGIRPAGEGGTAPALAVTINAIVDALADLGVRHVEMPATPERIWRAIHGKPDMSPTLAANN